MAEPLSNHEIVPINGQQSSWQPGKTYGCLSPVDIAPLDALIDDVHRTQAHILWLEHYIATVLTPNDVFTEMTQDISREQERTRIGKPNSALNAQPGSVRWQLEIARKRQSATQATRRRTHPAIHELQAERRHLADIATKAVALGIKLDQIDFSRSQADMIVQVIQRFASTQALNPTDPAIQQAITDAIDFVLNQRNQAT